MISQTLVSNILIDSFWSLFKLRQCFFLQMFIVFIITCSIFLFYHVWDLEKWSKRRGSTFEGEKNWQDFKCEEVQYWHALPKLPKLVHFKHHYYPFAGEFTPKFVDVCMVYQGILESQLASWLFMQCQRNHNIVFFPFSSEFAWQHYGTSTDNGHTKNRRW